MTALPQLRADGYCIIEQVFDFNNISGVLSSNNGTNYNLNITPATAANPVAVVGTDLVTPYGIEFSDNNRYLYVGELGIVQPQTRSIYQYDLISGNRVKVATFSNDLTPYNIGALQVGSDGRIYCALSNQKFLGIINNPNSLFSGNPNNFNFVNQFNLDQSTRCHLGLPTFVPELENIGDITVVGDCQFQFNYTGAGTILAWDFGDSNSSTDPSPSHVYSHSGSYTVQLHLITPAGCENTLSYSLEADVCCESFINSANFYYDNATNTNITNISINKQT